MKIFKPMALRTLVAPINNKTAIHTTGGMKYLLGFRLRRKKIEIITPPIVRTAKNLH